MDAVEGAAVAEPGDLLACGLDAGHLVVRDLAGEPAGDFDVGDGGGQAAGHGGAGQHHHPGVDGHVDGVGVTPAELGVGGVADLAEDEVGGVLPPGQRPQGGGDADRQAGTPAKAGSAAVQERASSIMERTVRSLVRVPEPGLSP